MKMLSPCLLGLSLAVASCSLAAAQEMSPATPSMPKVLQVTREFTKPYKNGKAHDKTEGAFLQAMSRARWPTHYLGMTSLSGKQRALYFTGYDSFDAWEKDSAAVDKNTSLSAELERASIADGELLDAVDQMVYSYNEKMSYRPSADLAHQRYMEISVYHVRPGHGEEWREVVKMAQEANEKGDTSAHWATYELIYGGESGTYAVLSADKSLAEIDKGFEDDKKFEEALGEEGMKKFRELYGAAVDTAHQELFALNPHMSYVGEDLIKADSFWKPSAPAPKPAAEPVKPKP
ncbi:MAG: hypothetical protein P4K86_03555 [Terracidiphilus sp.]|nr:hypothetical protein [Terracidiphilus sp.]MDR3777147.1 hypothetical protein [Terracidiphilus sp.]